MNTECEQAYHDEWDEAIIQRQRKITETSKKLEMKKLYQALIILDDYADSHQHLGELPEAEAHQRSGAGEHAIPLLLRNQHELDAFIEEHRIYEQATREPYSFLFVYYLKLKSQMF